MCNDRSVSVSVLIVDDHAAFRRLARRLLEEAGVVVVGEAGDGAEAVEAVRKLRPDAVLLDVLLPDCTGFAVAERLASGPRPPVVVLTSSRSEANFGVLIETAPARGFIAKRDLSFAALAALLGEPA